MAGLRDLTMGDGPEPPAATHGPPAGEVERVAQELASVARETARLLLRPRYDEAELAELDLRARELRGRLRAATLEERAKSEPPELRNPGEVRSQLVSGG